MRKFLLTLLIPLCWSAAYGRIVARGNASVFSPPLPPMVLAFKEDRLQYMAEHYWKGLDYASDAWIADTVALKQVFVDWLPLLGQLSPANRQKAAPTIITYGNEYPVMQKWLGELAESYFNDANSPYRNEELYIPILRALIEAPLLKDFEKDRYRYQLQIAMMNRPGTKAADVALVTRERKTLRLADIDKDFVMLYFFNPDCSACQTISAYITNSTVFKTLADKGEMLVVAIYPDEDLDAWEKHIDSLPEWWLVTHYRGSVDRDAYDLPAIPNLYLLDKDKKVILKDATVEQIEKWLYANFWGMN